MLIEDIPDGVRARMRELEAIDERDRTDGTPQLKRLRQVPPEGGQLLTLLAAAAPQGDVLDIGTSAGYSALWLILACQQRAGKLTTFELLPEKVDLARETFASAGVAAFVDQIHGDARGHLKGYDEVGFCFLDAEKEMYQECYELIIPNLVTGGLLVADNVIDQSVALEEFVAHVHADERVHGVVLPVGNGMLVARKLEPVLAAPHDSAAEEGPAEAETKSKRRRSKK